jgi:drug/metabolite transporter (DMT)-like permease
VFEKKSSGAIIFSLLLTVVLWGASNAATKHVVGSAGAGASPDNWPPIWTGSTRFLCGGLVMWLIMRVTTWLGELKPLSKSENRGLWLRTGLSLAVYIVFFNEALHYTAASHVALYLGASPVWTLLWEERPAWTRRSLKRYGAAALALSGVVVLFWPALRSGTAGWIGELFGLVASVFWALYGRQCRVLGARLSGAEVTAHTMWRAGLLLLPVAAFEVVRLGRGHGGGLVLLERGFWRSDLVLAQVYSFIGGGVVAYGLWSNALRHWPTSQVYLFNNLIPLSTMTWCHFCLGEPVTSTFWFAMLLIACGVALGQARWEKVLGANWAPAD